MNEVIRTNDIFTPADDAATQTMVLRLMPIDYAHRWQLGAQGAVYFDTVEEVADFLHRYARLTWFRPCRVTSYGLRNEYHITLAKRAKDISQAAYDNLTRPCLEEIIAKGN